MRRPSLWLIPLATSNFLSRVGSELIKKAGNDESLALPDLIDSLNMGCLKNHCRDELVTCEKQGLQCAERLRCSVGDGDDTSEPCYEGLELQDADTSEMGILQCAKGADCYDGGLEWGASTLLDLPIRSPDDDPEDASLHSLDDANQRARAERFLDAFLHRHYSSDYPGTFEVVPLDAKTKETIEAAKKQLLEPSVKIFSEADYMDYLGDLVDAAATDEELVSSPEFKEVKEDLAARSAGLPTRLDEIHAAFAEVASLLEKGTSSGPVPIPIPTPIGFRNK